LATGDTHNLNIQQALLAQWESAITTQIQTHQLLSLPEQLILREQANTHGMSVGDGRVALAQLNLTPGCLAQNARKIWTVLQTAEALQLDLAVFSELSLMGYSPKDMILRFPFLANESLKWLDVLAQKTGQTHALVGFAEPNTTGTGKPYFNSVALIGQGKVQQIFRKTLLPSYNEFEDTRQFESWQYGTPVSTTWQENEKNTRVSSPVFELYGRRYGVLICEDMWQGHSPFKMPLYPSNPMDVVLSHHPDILVNCSASPSRQGKAEKRHRLCQFIAQQTGKPLLYVNQVGTLDEIAFDGASSVYTDTGECLVKAQSFQEDCRIIETDRLKCWHLHRQPTPVQPDSSLETSSSSSFLALGRADLPRAYAALLQGIRDYFKKTGFQRAVLGLSGGLDSSVTAVLLVDALGAENVAGFSMPSDLTPTQNRLDAQQLATHLGIHFCEVSIVDSLTIAHQNLASVCQAMDTCWPLRDAASNATENIQAITRATLLRQIGNTYKALPIATSDKSEFYLGYATVNGDMSGALAPLGDLCKTRVRELAKWLNQNRSSPDAIPEAVMSKPSGADLKRDVHTGKLVTAEDELMPYLFADEIIWRIEVLHQSYQEMLETPFWFEQENLVSNAKKEEWLQRFFKRMGASVFKWFVAPPVLMMDQGGSLAKSDYHHLITSQNIEWKGHSIEEMQAFINS
jgi:NAD+ synthase (glutamine-hydrolysing)